MKDQKTKMIFSCAVILIYTTAMGFLFNGNHELSNKYLFAIVTASTALFFCSIYISLKKHLAKRKEIKIQKIMDEIEKDDSRVGEGRILRFGKAHILIFMTFVALAFSILVNEKKAIENIVFCLSYLASFFANTLNYFLDGHLYLIPAFLLTIFSIVFICKPKR